MHRRSSILAKGLECRLTAWAAAGGALAAGLAASPLAAEVVYTPVHQNIKNHHPYHLDLNLDQIADFYLVNNRGCNFDSCGAALVARPLKGNGVEGIHNAYALRRGAHIGSDHPFSALLMFS